MEMQQNHHMPTCIHQTPEQLLYNCLHCRPLVRIQPGARIPPARPGGGLKPKLMNVQRNQSRFNTLGDRTLPQVVGRAHLCCLDPTVGGGGLNPVPGMVPGQG